MKANRPPGFDNFDKRMRSKLAQMRPLGDGVHVCIVGKHPHAGKEGTIHGGRRTSPYFDMPPWEVRFEDGDGCFANETDLRRLD